MKFILGKKLGMTQVFRDNGAVVPVTRVQAGPCVVTQVKSIEKDRVRSVQIGYGDQKKFRLSKSRQGHLGDLKTVRFLRDNRIEEGHSLKRGDTFRVNIFSEGEKVQVTGRSKGKGFQGVVKRHGFHGSPASHGHKDQLRMPGSIGATGPARVFKGTRMGGHMGDQQVTVKNLEILKIDVDNNELFIKGALPGARNGLLMVATNEGKIEVDVSEFVEERKEEGVKEIDQDGGNETGNMKSETRDTVATDVLEQKPVKDKNSEETKEVVQPEENTEKSEEQEKKDS
jgi:large subunit ribosomal protein L3